MKWLVNKIILYVFFPYVWLFFILSQKNLVHRRPVDKLETSEASEPTPEPEPAGAEPEPQLEPDFFQVQLVRSCWFLQINFGCAFIYMHFILVHFGDS